MTQDMIQKSLDTQTSLAVIGAGVVGLCIALEAQRNGYQVTLFDKDLPGKGASFGNAGYLATQLIDPLATKETLTAAPKLWLDPNGPLSLPLKYLPKALPWLVRFVRAASSKNVENGRKALHQLNQAAIPAWKRCLADIDAQEYIVASGYLLVWESQSKLDEAKAQADYLASWGIDTVLLNGEEVREKEPELAKSVTHGLFFPEACRVKDPYLLCKQLFAVFQSRGGIFKQEKVSNIVPEKTTVKVVTSEDNVFDQAVVCTGVWGKASLEKMGISVPLEAERGYHITLEENDNEKISIKHMVTSADRRFVLSPLESGLRIVGISEIGGLDLPPLARSFNALRHHSRQLLPKLNQSTPKEIEWMGYRPTLPDSLPVIDQHPQYPHVLFAFGHQHLGLTQAAISAELVMNLMEKTEPDFDLSPYRVNRF